MTKDFRIEYILFLRMRNINKTIRRLMQQIN